MKSKKSIVLIINIILLCNNYLFSQDENFHYIEFGDKGTNEYLFNPNSKSIPSFAQSVREFNNLLEIQADFNMSYIWIYNDSGFEFFDQIDTNYVIISLPSGNYNIITGYAPDSNHHVFITKENIDVTINNQLKILYKEAENSNTYVFNKINSDSLNIGSIFFYFNSNLDIYGLNIRHININANYFKLTYNSLPADFEGEWSLKGKPEYNDGDLYLLNNQLLLFDSDTIITNNINNYAFADIDYVLPDSILYTTQKQIFTFIPDFHMHGSGDLFYTYPLTQRIYQDTSASTTLLSSKFWQSLIINNVSINHTYIATSEIQFSNNKIIGRHFRDSDSTSFILSDTNFVKLGQMPTFWFGKFTNSIDTIKIKSSYGMWDYLFLSQTNDLLRHYPIDYKIYQSSNLIGAGEFNLLYGAPGLRLGFNPDDLTIPIQPGQYTLEIDNNFNEVGGIQGFSNVKASFNLNYSDKNPPNIVSFQLISGKEITNRFLNNSNNKIRFVTQDNVMVDSVALYYSSIIDSIRQEIPLILKEPYYEGILPELPPGYYNLCTIIMDNSQNYIECNMNPAFVIDSSILSIQDQIMSINEFELFQNYPNPFNSTTIIPFRVPFNINTEINIAVYNLIGQKILTLFEGYNRSVNGSINWDGCNNNGIQLSSGIYFIKMKGGRIQKTIKIIILR